MASKIILALCLLVSATYGAPTVDILNHFDNNPTLNVLVSFKTSNVASITQSIKNRAFASRTDKIQALHDALKAHADATQSNVLDFLTHQQLAGNTKVRQLWITNQIVINNANRPLVAALLSKDEVLGIEEEKFFPLEQPINTVVYPGGSLPDAGEQWGVRAIETPEVWASGNRGQGVVIANIDSGVRGTHEALRDGFRSEHGWYDAQDEKPEPIDELGHGTHTMGTMVGRTNGIGVAPGAQWIACRGCTYECSHLQFLLCGQWAVCPTDAKLNNPRCDLAPHSVSNSWGFGGLGEDWYDEVLDLWNAADILPIFSIGNSGRTCSTTGSPGGSAKTLSVGATSEAGTIASFSSRGPAPDGRVQPDVSGPGQDVISAYINGDQSYASMSGTSMSAPHVGGLTALLYHVNANLTVGQARDAILGGARPITPVNQVCGGLRDDVYPNNVVGAGIINAPASIATLKDLMN